MNIENCPYTYGYQRMQNDQSVSAAVVDLHFHVQRGTVAVDHGYALYGAIIRLLQPSVPGSESWLHNADNVGLHMLRGRYLGNGRLLLGAHARFGLRLPAMLIPKALPLAGKRLDLGGESLRIGVATTGALIPTSALYAHVVTTRNGDEETRFDEEIARQLEQLLIRGKPTRGPRRIITIKGRKVVGHSLLVAELSAEESIRLQEAGLGGRRKMGCGVFVPHRSESL